MEKTIFAVYYRNVFESRWVFIKTYRKERLAKSGISGLLYHTSDDRKEIERKRYRIVPYDIRKDLDYSKY